jgi:hypothetical protein
MLHRRRSSARRPVAVPQNSKISQPPQPATGRGQAALRQAAGVVVDTLESRRLLAATVLYRVNAGGDAITDPAGNWAADTAGAPSAYVNSGSQTYSTGATIDLTDPSVPAGTPAALFQAERWDPAGGNEMSWSFPVTAGPKTVRLYFAEIFSGAGAAGFRQMDVSVEGTLVLDNYDVYADTGALNKAMVKSFRVNSDSVLNIDFTHVVENPAIKAIEIIDEPAQPNTLGVSTTSIPFGDVPVNSTANRVLTLTNLGGAGDPSITVSGASISGTNAADFATSFAGNIVLAPGQSAQLSVSAKPKTTGAKSAILSLVSTAANSPLAVGLTANATAATVPISFGKSTLANTAMTHPTSLQWGPDGRLYVAEEDGTILALTIAKNGANNYSVTATETIQLIYNIPNHDDNGAVNASVLGRLVTGILVTGTAASPVIYACSSDPRIGGGGSGTDTNLDTNSGILSRLTKTATGWAKQDLVRGLTRSEENHSENGLAISPDGKTIYIAVGGNTNMGAPSNNFAYLPEFALSACILSVDLTNPAIASGGTYDLPTLDDEDKPNVSGSTTDVTDPFGGNDGKNQAKLVPGGPVQVYSPGYRNPYDILIASDGRMWTVDNGANAGWGDVPVGTGGAATNQPNEPGVTTPDRLVLVTPGKYGGHPNPTRANAGNTFNTTNPQSPVSAGNPVEGTYTADDPGVALATFSFSTNGLTEYSASNFNGAMKGDLLTASFGNAVYRLKLNADGTVTSSTLFSTVGAVPLDVTAVGDAGVFPGTVWVCDWQNNNVVVFEPGTVTGTGANDPTLDDDGDKYNNQDEILNGTDPLNGADVPPDWDLDYTSDLLDPNDDNDALDDTKDPFAIDPNNGKTTGPRVSYQWENEGVSAGKLLGLGFTGLMTNLNSNYASLFDKTKLTAGGAAGVLTIDSATAGDALGTANSQAQAFQIGLNVTPSTAPPASPPRQASRSASTSAPATRTTTSSSSAPAAAGCSGSARRRRSSPARPS